MQKYEFQSPRRRVLERVRKWVALISMTVTASIFWGMLFAGLVKYALDLSQEQTQVVFIPAAMMVGAFCYFIRHKLARAVGFYDQ